MIAIASDHAGYLRKEEIKKWLEKQSIDFIDLGTNSEEKCDYPVFANKIAQSVLKKKCDLGILICGSGIGMSIAVNRHKGVRGALCLNTRMARLAREHNNANVLCMPARKFHFFRAKRILKTFLNCTYDGGRHDKRIAMMDE